MLIVRKAFALLAGLGAVVLAGCAASPDADNEAADPGAKGEEAVGSVAQAVVPQDHALLACDNDVPASGFLEFPWNDHQHAETSGYRTGCVGFRVDRNLPFPTDVPSEAQAVARFPQYEGTWTAAKEQQCRNSIVDMRIATKFNESSSWNDTYIEGWGKNASPSFEYFPGTSIKKSITACSAQIIRGSGCSYYPKHNLMRIDVKAYPNGNKTDPGASRVYASFAHDLQC